MAPMTRMAFRIRLPSAPEVSAGVTSALGLDPSGDVLFVAGIGG